MSAPSKAQFWGGERDGEWLTVDPEVAESKKILIPVEQLTTVPHSKPKTIHEVYNLRFSPPRKQWYLVWSGYTAPEESSD